MRAYFLPLSLTALIVFSQVAMARMEGDYTAPQRPGRGQPPIGGSSNVGHTLFGDLKVDESKVSGNKPQTYLVILYSNLGNVIARQAVTNNGRFHFFNVYNGEYYLAVEVENVEVARLHLRVDFLNKTEIRRDIELEWREQPGASGSHKPGILSVADFYHRTSAQQNLLDKALEAVKRNDYKQAIALLNQIVSADAKDYEAWTELGTAYSKEGKLGEAEKAYQRALEEKPNFMLALLNLGKLHLVKKDYASAIEPLTRAVEADPKSADANHYLGEAYLGIKKGSTAVGYLNKAIQLDPVGKAEVHLRLALLYHAAGLKDKAVAEYEQFLAKKPDYPEKKRIQQYISENKKP